ncbi:hypothetical protein T4D_6822 [Trichinella pseudospiralis]|uniref:Uncharacterized protein n=1 Tax=Trichinella pseudospiralis TaxID=6337 RepID=A0A0V1FR07_TRIPS|nr:hypothetical protein T4D_13650 [Trichinella pseudospiralis]KRY93716.1 hypothetical protein T4D_6822 [Trichinella pseudospiralis]
MFDGSRCRKSFLKKPVFGSKSLPQFRRISRRSWEGFVSPARAEFISALKRSSSDSPYRSRRRRFNVSYGASPAGSNKSSTSGATESAMLKRAVAQTELPLARTIDADYVAKKAVI